MRADEAKGVERMKIGVLGIGMVGTTIATKLIALGNEVMLGKRIMPVVAQTRPTHA
jgi:predicted dinucleotide-binding enzyme